MKKIFLILTILLSLELLAEDTNASENNNSSESTINYMNNEPILYLSSYVTSTFKSTKQAVLGAQVGVYEDIYLLAEYGYYKKEENLNDLTRGSTGQFINFGLSYHIPDNKNSIITIEAIYRQMLNETYNNGTNVEASKKQAFIMVNKVWFMSNKTLGFEVGAGVGEDFFTFKAGLKFRYY